jgi:hypothetical protein
MKTVLHLQFACVLAALVATLSGRVQASDTSLPADAHQPVETYTTGVEDRTLKAVESRSKAQESVNALSSDIQALKQSVVALNKNLRVLEEDMLFPADTQVTVFLSLDVGEFFTLEAVKLKLDGKIVTSHIYSDRELTSLSKGGIHRLHMANLSAGKHTLSAFFTGMGPNGRKYKRGTTLKIDKKTGPKYVELRIADSSMKLQPEFSVQEW